MLKIGYIISSLVNEGPTRVLLNIVRHLEKERFRPFVVTLAQERSTSLLADFEQLGVPVIKLSEQTSGLMGRTRGLRAVLERERADIVHAHCPRSLFLMRFAAPRASKTAYTVHCYPTTQFKVIHGPVKGPIITAGANIALRFIDKPIACADSVAAEYFEKNRFEMCAVNNGIEEMGSAFEGTTREDRLRSLGLDPARRHLLFVGRLSAEKRITEFVQTFKAANLPGVDLVIVGSGAEETRISQIGAANVHLAGFQSDVRPYLEACDYYVSPSATEGLANSLLEAMSKGMLCLLSNIPSHEFVLRKCEGYVGELVDPISAVDFDAALTRLLSKDSLQVREGIRANFHRHFHARAMTRGYERVYEEITA